MAQTGHCRHGEFDLLEGCPQCIEERRRDFEESQHPASIKPEQDEMEAEPLVNLQAELKSGSYHGEEALEPDIPSPGGLAEAAQKAGAEVTVVKATFVMEPEAEAAKLASARERAPHIVAETEQFLNGVDTEINLCDICNQSQSECQHDPILVAECDGYLSSETAVVLRPGEDDEVRVYSKQAVGLLVYAERRVITTLEGNKAANDDLAIISKLKKLMESKRKEYLEPLKAQSDAIRGTYTSLMTPVLEADKITRGKMLAYTDKQDRIRQEQEEVNRLRLEAAQKEAALNNGEISESVNLVNVMPETTKRVSTDLGTSGQRDNWKYEVVDFASVPDEYKMINVGVLTPAAKSFKDKRTIPGIRIYNEPIIATRPR